MEIAHYDCRHALRREGRAHAGAAFVEGECEFQGPLRVFGRCVLDGGSRSEA